jgi:Trk K+ transport system NAD-binding subunit
MGTFKGSGQVLICGWNRKGSEILRELRAREVEDERDVVILAERETAPIDEKGITFIRGNPSSAEDLGRAGLERASTVIVLADESNASNEPDDVDARSLLTTLAVESINSDAYTTVEVVKSENRQHFERTNADELVGNEQRLRNRSPGNVADQMHRLMAEIARDARVKRMVLSHLNVAIDQDGIRERVLTEMGAIYPGILIWGQDLMEIALGMEDQPRQLLDPS